MSLHQPASTTQQQQAYSKDVELANALVQFSRHSLRSTSKEDIAAWTKEVERLVELLLSSLQQRGNWIQELNNEIRQRSSKDQMAAPNSIDSNKVLHYQTSILNILNQCTDVAAQCSSSPQSWLKHVEKLEEELRHVSLQHEKELIKVKVRCELMQKNMLKQYRWMLHNKSQEQQEQQSQPCSAVEFDSSNDLSILDPNDNNSDGNIATPTKILWTLDPSVHPATHGGSSLNNNDNNNNNNNNSNEPSLAQWESMINWPQGCHSSKSVIAQQSNDTSVASTTTTMKQSSIKSILKTPVKKSEKEHYYSPYWASPTHLLQTPPRTAGVAELLSASKDLIKRAVGKDPDHFPPASRPSRIQETMNTEKQEKQTSCQKHGHHSPSTASSEPTTPQASRSYVWKSIHALPGGSTPSPSPTTRQLCKTITPSKKEMLGYSGKYLKTHVSPEDNKRHRKKKAKGYMKTTVSSTVRGQQHHLSSRQSLDNTAWF